MTLLGWLHSLEHRPKLRSASVGSRLAVIGSGCLFIACSASVSSEQAEQGDAPGITRSTIRIERSSSPAGESTRAYALARFARISDAQPTRTLELLGLKESYPELGSCYQADFAGDPALAGLGWVELLEAGEITINAAGQTTTLAPISFPSVKNLVSGVVYSSRSQAAEPLPEAEAYRISAAGSSSLSPFELQAEAPASLSELFVQDTPFAELSEVSLNQSLDLSWAPGSTADLEASGEAYFADQVVLELSDGYSTLVCSFSDQAGSASIPAAQLKGFTASQDFATLSLHRIRTVKFSVEELNDSELHFDFEVETPVRLAR